MYSGSSYRNVSLESTIRVHLKDRIAVVDTFLLISSLEINFKRARRFEIVLMGVSNCDCLSLKTSNLFYLGHCCKSS